MYVSHVALKTVAVSPYSPASSLTPRQRARKAHERVHNEMGQNGKVRKGFMYIRIGITITYPSYYCAPRTSSRLYCTACVCILYMVER